MNVSKDIVRKISKRSIAKPLAALALSLFMVSEASAVVRVNSRDYIPAPAGANLYINYFIHLKGGDFNVHGESVGDSDLTGNIGVLRMVHYMDLFGMRIDPQFIIPMGNIDLNLGGAGSPFDQENTTYGDLTLTATFWLVNNPEEKEWFGITPFITAPIGNYDEDKPLGSLNIAENRWEFSPQIGYTKGFADKWYFEAYGEATWFQDNDEFNFGGVPGVLEQDVEFNIQAMFSYDLDPTALVAVRALHMWGGEQTLNGVQFIDDKNTTELSVMYEKWVSKSDQIMFEFSKDLHVENGPETAFFQFRYIHVF